MRDYVLDDIADIKAAPRQLTLEEYFKLCEAEWHMRERRIQTQSIRLRLYNLVMQAHRAYRGHRSSPWKDDYTRKDKQIWEPEKIPLRQMALDALIRSEQVEQAKVQAKYDERVRQRAIPSDPDYAPAAKVFEVSPFEIARSQTRAEPESVQLERQTARLDRLEQEYLAANPPPPPPPPPKPPKPPTTEKRHTMSEEGRKAVSEAAKRRWEERRAKAV